MKEKLPDIAKVKAWLSEKMLCPLCGIHYSLDGIRVVRNQRVGDHQVKVHASCGKCHCSLLFALELKEGDVYLIGVVTDLTPEDADKFYGREPISLDEVIDWHVFWKDFEGSMSRLSSHLTK